jgi:endonuclease G
MQLRRNQWFGVIILIILITASFLVMVEPWKESTSTLFATLERSAPPVPISIDWDRLDIGYPVTDMTDTILTYTGFDLGYNEHFEQASWVVYVLTREEIVSGTEERPDRFRPDTSIFTGSAALSDYRGSGFDRGHLAPAADMKWSEQAMDESFLLSNISPQNPSFNRGIWKKLEEKVRQWAVEKDSLYVITGPVLDPIRGVIGQNEVGVPGSYFKVLVDLSPPEFGMIAFLLPNNGSSKELTDYAITVDSLEIVTGYDFFAGAPDQEMIEWMEGKLVTDDWK